VQQLSAAARPATYPQNILLEATAFEVSLELPIYVRWQFPALCRQLGLEHRIVFFEHLRPCGPKRDPRE